MLANFSKLDRDALVCQRAEAEPCATGLQCWNYLGNIVADEAEPGCLGILLNNSSEGELGGRGHVVALVEDDEFDAAAQKLLRAAEVFDLVTDHVDASIVTGVELERHVLVGLLSIDLLGNC